MSVVGRWNWKLFAIEHCSLDFVLHYSVPIFVGRLLQHDIETLTFFDEELSETVFSILTCRRDSTYCNRTEWERKCNFRRNVLPLFSHLPNTQLWCASKLSTGRWKFTQSFELITSWMSASRVVLCVLWCSRLHDTFGVTLIEIVYMNF